MKKLALLLFIVLFSVVRSVFGEDFTVTSNADNGPGTLREAIQKANSNVPGTIDRILFNLPGSTLAGRTIRVLSGLPALNPGLIIDGSSQPSPKIGVSDARVIIEYLDPAAQSYINLILFDARGSRDISIFGISARYVSWSLFYRIATGVCTEGASNIQIGAPGKGNVLNGWSNAIGDIPLSGGPFQIKDADSIFIKSNFLGLREDGDKIDFDNPFGYPNAMNIYGVYMRQIGNIEIGGPATEESNVFNYFYSAIDLNRAKSKSGFCRIMGNRIGCDYTGTNLRSVIGSNYGAVYCNSDNAKIQDNLILGKGRGSGIEMNSAKGFQISGNYIGVYRNGVDANCGFFQGIIIDFCENALVGGPDPKDKNVIGYTTNLGAITTAYCFNIKISRNSLYCNSRKGSIAHLAYDGIKYISKPFPFITINSVVGNTYSGKAMPNAFIEIFTDNQCKTCDANIYLTTIQADANGNWTYNSPVSGPIHATATDRDGATSEVSTADIRFDNLQVQSATCGRANGSIKNIRIVSGTKWHWENESGTIVGTDTNLVGVPAGRYRLIADIGDHGCSVTTGLLDIPALEVPKLDSTMFSLVHPSCGQSSGSITLKQFFREDYNVRLTNEAGQIISTTINFTPATSLLPGKYNLVVNLKKDTACRTVFPISLVNQQGPSLDISGIRIESATCGRSNGSIKNITHSNAVGQTSYVWMDAKGKVVGNQGDLLNVPSGNYQLKFKDNSSCDTIITPYFSIGDTGTIRIDTLGMKITSSSCTAPTGNVTGLKVYQAQSYTWKNVTTGVTASSGIDLTQQSPGSYKLILTNSFGCSAETAVFTIPPASFPDLKFTTTGSSLATCNNNNGSVKIAGFNLDTDGYQFWITDSSNRLIQNGTEATGLAAGLYKIFARDKNSCEKELTSLRISAVPKPAFIPGSEKITDDQCNLKVGSITDLKLNNLNGPTSYRWLKDNDTVSTSKDLSGAGQGTYRLVVTDAGSCTIVSDPFQVKNNDLVLRSADPINILIPRHQSASIVVKPVSPGTVYNLYANPAGTQLISQSPTGSFTTPAIHVPTTYYVAAERGSCRSPLSKVFIDVSDSTKVYVPTAFTPNRDGKNDQLKVLVQGIFYLEEFKIFDSWGNLIFMTSDITKGWDGTYKGNSIRSGTYVWMLKGTDLQGNRVIKKGTVTLIGG
jgi:gliding motility-associated-like protein